MKRTHTFEAEDGTTFSTAEECKRHEDKLFYKMFCNLTLEEVTASIERIAHSGLSDAFERAGNIIAARRRESGDLKRSKKQASGAEFQSVEKAMGKTARAGEERLL